MKYQVQISYTNPAHEHVSLRRRVDTITRLVEARNEQEALNRAANQQRALGYLIREAKVVQPKVLMESPEYVEPEVGTVRAHMMINTKKPTVQVQEFKHDTIRGDKYWVTTGLRSFNTIDQAEAHIARINGKNVAEEVEQIDEMKSSNPRGTVQSAARTDGLKEAYTLSRKDPETGMYTIREYAPKCGPSKTVSTHSTWEEAKDAFAKLNEETVLPFAARELYAKTYAKNTKTVLDSKSAREIAYAAVKRQFGDDVLAALKRHHDSNEMNEAYDETAVNKAIASSNRGGRKISGREARAIHRVLSGGQSASEGQRHPLEGHEYHRKSDAELRFIAKDAAEAARSMKGLDSNAENKYLDQVNDASTVLHWRRQNGTPDWYREMYSSPMKESQNDNNIRAGFNKFKYGELAAELGGEGGNNYSVHIDGRRWKVFGDLHSARRAAQTLLNRGKNAEVRVTGEPVSEALLPLLPSQQQIARRILDTELEAARNARFDNRQAGTLPPNQAVLAFDENGKLVGRYPNLKTAQKLKPGHRYEPA